MKRRVKLLGFFILLAGVWLLASSDVAPPPASYYVPYYMELSELRKSVSYTSGKREMQNPGKIWIRDGGSEIFIVERYKGVHIIDNSTPAAPVQTGFIIAPGCMDVALKGSIIYLDNAIDLVAFDLDSREVTERIKDFFPEPSNPAGDSRYYPTPSNLVRVGWQKVNANK